MFVCLNDTRCQECWTVDVVVGVVVDETQAVDSTSHVNIKDIQRLDRVILLIGFIDIRNVLEQNDVNGSVEELLFPGMPH